MKGKKINNDFVSSFIQECCQDGKNSVEDIYKSAELKISEIDNQLSKIQELKKRRSDLMDVLGVLKQNKKNIKYFDDLLVKFYMIDDKFYCKKICENLSSYDLKKIKSFSEKDIYCIKNLLEIKVLSKNDNNLIAGENFYQFKNFLKELKDIGYFNG